MFLAKESFTKDLRIRQNYKDIITDEIVKDDIGRFIKFYKDTTSAQARLMDFVADTQFILQLIRTVAFNETQNPIPLFPYVDHIAKDVILNKTLSHDNAKARLNEALEEAGYYKQFDTVLTDILSDWEIF